MQPIALQGKIAPFDPMGAMQQGIQLGQMGLQTQKMQQDLIQQKLNEERLRQTIGTEAIGQQEAQRALAQRQREDTARITLADIMKRHTRPDASGRSSTDLRAALAEARMAGLDPAYTAELEGKLFANEASSLKNEAARVDYIKKTLDERAPMLRYMDEGKAVRSLEQIAPLLARAVGMPTQEIGRIVAEHFDLGRPGSSIVKTAQMFTDAQIAQERERQMAGAGIGREDFDPSSTSSRQAREFLASRGISVPSNVNLVDMRKDPRFGPALKEYEMQVTGVVPSAEMRREDVIKAAEFGASRKTYNDALAFEQELKQTFGTRPGSFTQEQFNKWIGQDPRRALLQSAIDNYERETGTKLDVATLGIPATIARLRGQEGRLRGEQEARAKLSTTPSISAVGATKMPGEPGQTGEKVSPETQKARDTDAAAIIQSEYQKEVANLQTNPGDKRIASNVDALARELKREHKITVAGSSDVLRGAVKAPAATAAPAETTVRVRNKATGTTYKMPKDVAERALASGKYERI